MVASTYDEALRRLLVHEGGYGNHPNDPGGPTNFGITLADYRRYVNPSAGVAEMKAMRVEEAKAIYRERYWSALRCDELPTGLDYAVFDYGVNSGIARAARVLHRIAGFPDNSRIGDALLAAVRKRSTPDLIAQLCDERLAFLKRLRTWSVFGAGWGRRVSEVRRVALAMAASRTRDESAASASAGKGAAPINRKGQQASAGGVIAAGAVAAQQAHEAGVGPAVVIVILVITAVLAAAAWWWWRRRQRQQQER